MCRLYKAVFFTFVTMLLSYGSNVYALSEDPPAINYKLHDAISYGVSSVVEQGQTAILVQAKDKAGRTDQFSLICKAGDRNLTVRFNAPDIYGQVGTHYVTDFAIQYYPQGEYTARDLFVEEYNDVLIVGRQGTLKTALEKLTSTNSGGFVLVGYLTGAQGQLGIQVMSLKIPVEVAGVILKELRKYQFGTVCEDATGPNNYSVDIASFS